MINLIKFSLILLFGCFLFSGCSNDDDSNISNQYLTAKIDGLDFAAEPINSIKILRNTDNYGTNLYVKGISLEGDFIEFVIYSYKGPGKYYFGNNYFDKSWIKFHQLSSLEEWETIMDLNKRSNFVEITLNDGVSIEGNFSFDGKSKMTGVSKLISDGVFRANY
ncbi:hypothetical protein [Christiangramia forsetii]|uniref:Secreted protein n=2 Tax=Christiangramia forsetii TaxID=411153 RepID=A0M2D2_CHRFK|nr:hypothetical protein [Christiangramia forsetii]GGG39434.1 hypothetical protein GCM10011532_24000 [Christiangramia forsetii]CAL66777.1 secreted protein [Christiangramia forsetii KT0803]